MSGRGVPYVDGRGLGAGGSVYVLGREKLGGENGPDDANNIILVK